MNRRLNYLNLEISNYSKSKKIIDNSHLECNIESRFKHTLHSNSEHLNSITDLLINLASNLESDLSIIKTSINIEQTNKKVYIDIVEKLDYIKNTKENKNIELITQRVSTLKERIIDIEDNLKEIKNILAPEENITKLINDFKTLNLRSNPIGKRQSRSYYRSWKTNSK